MWIQDHLVKLLFSSALFHWKRIHLTPMKCFLWKLQYLALAFFGRALCLYFSYQRGKVSEKFPVCICKIFTSSSDIVGWPMVYYALALLSSIINTDERAAILLIIVWTLMLSNDEGRWVECSRLLEHGKRTTMFTTDNIIQPRLPATVA